MTNTDFLFVNNLTQFNLLQLLKKSLLSLGCETQDFTDELLNELWCLEFLSNNILTYYAVRLKLLEFLMFRKFRNIDNATGIGRGITTSKNKSHSDRKAGSLGNEYSDSYDQESGTTRSDEVTKTKTTDSGISEANSCNEENHRSLGTDKGTGTGYGFSDNVKENANVNQSNSHTEYDGTTTGGGNKVGCSFSRSEEKTTSDSSSLGSTPPALFVTWSKSYGVSSATAQSAWSKGLFDSSAQSETTIRKGKSSKTVNNKAAGYATGKSQSGNEFQSNTHNHGQRASGGNSDDYSSHVKRSWTYGYGSGETYSMADSWNESGTKLKSSSSFRQDSDAVSDGSENFHYYASKDSQLFNNLKMSYEVTLDNINWLLHIDNQNIGTNFLESSFIKICELPNYSYLNYARVYQAGFKHQFPNLPVGSGRLATDFSWSSTAFA